MYILYSTKIRAMGERMPPSPPPQIRPWLLVVSGPRYMQSEFCSMFITIFQLYNHAITFKYEFMVNPLGLLIQFFTSYF
jgi:hypothetical protein